jgi:hypothetical protein
MLAPSFDGSDTPNESTAAISLSQKLGWEGDGFSLEGALYGDQVDGWSVLAGDRGWILILPILLANDGDINAIYIYVYYIGHI